MSGDQMAVLRVTRCRSPVRFLQLKLRGLSLRHGPSYNLSDAGAGHRYELQLTHDDCENISDTPSQDFQAHIS
jgi:hypothetical protein